MKKKPSQPKDDHTMSFDLFERDYADEISWQVEILLQDGIYNDDQYDEAYEHAVEAVAEDHGIELI
jgi:hypothetical protein